MENNKIRIDYLKNHIDYKVAQHVDMYHFNTDTCLLGEFIKINSNESVLDVGTNNGALLVYIIKKGGIATGIDINKEALDVAKITLEINNLNAELIPIDFINFDESYKYDVIVSNPPYFDSIEKEQNDNYYKKIARHEGSLNLVSLAKSLAKHLKENGRVYLVYRPDRINKLERELSLNGLYINKIQKVYEKTKKVVKSVLLEISFNKTDITTLENQYI